MIPIPSTNKRKGEKEGRLNDSKTTSSAPPENRLHPMNSNHKKKKTRFDGLDVAAMTSHVQKNLLGCKLVNVYDGMALLADSSKSTFVLKFASEKSNTSHPNNTENDENGTTTSNNRTMLLIESGVRFHMTKFVPTSQESSSMASSTPSSFAMKLRKHLRNARLECITQLGLFDRVIDIRFGSGSHAHHLIVELYGQGNIILTDAQYSILNLLRCHEFDTQANLATTTTTTTTTTVVSPLDGEGGNVKVRVGHVYPVTYTTTLAWSQGITASHSTTSTSSTDETTHTNTISVPSEKETRNSIDPSQNQKQTLTKYTSILDPNRTVQQVMEWARDEFVDMTRVADVPVAHPEKTNKKSQNHANQPTVTLKALLLRPSSGVFHYGPSLIEHCLLHANLDVQMKLTLADVQLQYPSQVQVQSQTQEKVPMSMDHWSTLMASLRQEGSRILQQLSCTNSQSGEEKKGYILYRPKPILDIQEEKDSHSSHKNHSPNITIPHADKIFEEFQPHLLLQHQNRPVLEYTSFTNAVDEFFSLFEGQKRALRAEIAENAARQKLESIKVDQEHRYQSLLKEADTVFHHAKLVEVHSDDVDKAIGVINSALATGMDWDTLDQLVRVEKANENPIALLIQKLDLAKDHIVLSLPDTLSWDYDILQQEQEDYDEEMNEEDDDQVPEYETNHSTQKKRELNPHASNILNQSASNLIVVPITLSLHENAHGNARLLYEQYRSARDKAEKTAGASSKAIRAAEAAAQRQLMEAQRGKRMLSSMLPQHQRKIHWFEKFNFFITSENYLVIAGRDAQQNEVLVKKYLRPGDAYIHADIHGAPTVILRAKRRRVATLSVKSSNDNTKECEATEIVPLSEQALREAGNFAMCRSSAWPSKIVTSAWWVDSHQVSKTAPTGEYLTTGSFMVRGKKNYLPASHLELGLAVLFRLGDEASIARHTNERRDYNLTMLEDHPTTHEVSSVAPVRSNCDDVEIIKDVVEDFDRIAVNHDSISSESEDDGVGTINLGTSSKLSTVEQEDRPMRPMLADSYEHRELGSHKSPFNPDFHGIECNNTARNSGVNNSLPKTNKPSNECGIAKNKGVKADNTLGQASADRKGPKNDVKNGKQVSSSVANTRGKKAKLKKIAKKYADQDDEDRELALLALQGGEKAKKIKDKGSRSNIVMPTSSNQVKASADAVALLFGDPTKVAVKLPMAVQSILQNSVTVDSQDASGKENNWASKFDTDVLEALMHLDSFEQQMAVSTRLFDLSRANRIENFSASLSGIIRAVRRYGLNIGGSTVSATDQLSTMRSNSITVDGQGQSLIENETVEDDGMNDKDLVDDTTEISKLTGKPLQEDVLLYAIPVCGPYSSLSQYKYRVKLTPGSLKRGKASKQCLDLLLKDCTTETREFQLIKMLSDTDIVHVICGDVKISAAGASKVLKKQASNKKREKQ